MYSRKIKLATSKKKTKSTGPPGSNWGPAIAIAQKEKAISTCLSLEDKYAQAVIRGNVRLHHSYANTGNGKLFAAHRKACNNEHSHHHPHQQLSHPSRPKKVSISSESGHSHTTSSSSNNNNYIYNYARKASTTSAGSDSNRSFFLFSPFKSMYGSKIAGNAGTNNLGSIRTSSSVSQVTSKPVGRGTVRQPLTLIIPSTSEAQEQDFVDRGQDSFPSTQTYRSSCSSDADDDDNDDDEDVEDETIRNNGKAVHIHTLQLKDDNDYKTGSASQQGVIEIKSGSATCRNYLGSKSDDPALNLGILKMSTTQAIVDHYHVNEESSFEDNTACDHRPTVLYNKDKRICKSHETIESLCSGSGHKLRMHKEDNHHHQEIYSSTSAISEIIKNSGNKRKGTSSIGSTISSLAQGITMVYVPMESLPRSKSAAVLNASLEFDPDLCNLVNGSKPNDEASNNGGDVFTGEGAGEEEEGGQRDDVSSPSMSEEKDADNDSLLGSFDSIMFQPKHENDNAIIQTTSSLSSPNSSLSSYHSRRSRTPPLHAPQVQGAVTITNINAKTDEIKPSHSAPHHHFTCIKSSEQKATTGGNNKPPPLPPKNPSMLKLRSKARLKFNDGMFANIIMRNNNNCKDKAEAEKSSPRASASDPLSQTQKEMNIRIAVENLEQIIRPQQQQTQSQPTLIESTSSPPMSSNISNSDEKDKREIKKTKRVTLTLPSPNNNDAFDGPPLLHNFNLYEGHNGGGGDTDTEIDVYSSTFLTCGHVLKEDNYSTLSSTHSPKDMEKVNDDLLRSNSSSVSHSPTAAKENSASNNNSNTTSSGGECSPTSLKEKHRSVLQQLRELSILIGGGNSGEERCNRSIKEMEVLKHEPNTNDKGFMQMMHADEPGRKLSDATDNSADSGKGSDESNVSGSSPKSLESDGSPQQSLDNMQAESLQKTCHGSVAPCVFRSDCNECLMFNKPPEGFRKPDSSSVLCQASVSNKNSVNDVLRQSAAASKKLKSTIIVRRKSSRSSKVSSNKGTKYKKKKHLVLDYCECSGCACDEPDYPCNSNDEVDGDASVNAKSEISYIGVNDPQQRLRKYGRSISVTTPPSAESLPFSPKLSRSLAFRGARSINARPFKDIGNIDQHLPLSPQCDLSLVSNGLFTIEEEDTQSVDSRMRKSQYNNAHSQNAGTVMGAGGGGIDVNYKTNHWHPDCWLAADPLLSGWSDLESLYSLNVKNDTPLSINGECWTCWQEISEIKRNSDDPNATVARTGRMFIWLNKRQKEFQAPWWEAKKQASIRWIMTKALIHVPKEYLMDPFKETKKFKPTRYKLRDEVVKGLVSGKLYSLALSNLYREALCGSNGGTSTDKGMCHWDIIKILSRKGVYVAQPSDMKLTEGTLRKKPIKIAAHIALIEAIMSLYAKEVLARERIVATLYTFGCAIKPETTSPEKLVIAWINAAVLTLKSYIISTRSHQMSPEKQSRWRKLGKVGEIRDLCDGIGICSLFAIYCSKDIKVSDICVPEPGETLTIYDSITNHSLVQKLCEQIFPETIYHLCVTDFLYIHGYMKQNILCFLVDLFIHLEVNPIVRVDRLTHVPIRVDLV